jgi:acetyl-CoA synthetase
MALQDHRDVKDQRVYAPIESNSKLSKVGPTLEDRMKQYRESVEQPSQYWARVAKQNFFWKTLWESDDNVFSFNFDKTKGPISIKWFDGATTNICYNAVDRHIEAGKKDKVAFYWEGNDVGETSAITYGQLHDEVSKLAYLLKTKYGVTKGTRVSIYLPMITLGPIAMLAVARLGAVASVVFGGFSAHSLSARIIDSESTVLITAEGTMRGDKPIHLKKIVDEALADAEAQGVACKAIVFERHGRDGVPMKAGRDAWYQDEIAALPAEAASTPVEWVEAEHPLFLLYTSGSTGKPKGLEHTTGGYMVYAHATFTTTFDYHDEDVYFCTGDIGWITGHTYATWGPLLAGSTSVLFEGVPTHPTPSRWWDIVDKFKVTQFYTAPTAIRALMKGGEAPVKKTSRASLRVLGSVGEPINVEAWNWYYNVVGEGHCDIVDTWWQTETGGHMITPLPGNTPLKPGSATLPFFGVQPVLLDPTTLTEVQGAGEGLLVIKHSWPGQSRTIFKDAERFAQTYFPVDGYYMTGDGARRDADGYYWLTGRVDDVLNVSGHRLGTSEVECAVNTHPDVVESAVVGIPHDVKGEGIYVFVCFKEGTEVTQKLLDSVKAIVRNEIGAIATPDAVHPALGLPKTRSGKIMRRILRKIAAGQLDELGDISTLADPSVVEELIALKALWVDKKKS